MIRSHLMVSQSGQGAASENLSPILAHSSSPASTHNYKVRSRPYYRRRRLSPTSHDPDPDRLRTVGVQRAFPFAALPTSYHPDRYRHRGKNRAYQGATMSVTAKVVRPKISLQHFIQNSRSGSLTSPQLTQLAEIWTHISSLPKALATNRKIRSC